MNRRSFFTKLGLAAATLAILPTATTYSRNWVAPSKGLGRVLWMPNPEWINAPYEMAFLSASNGLHYAPPDFPLPIVRYHKNNRCELVEVPRFIQVEE